MRPGLLPTMLVWCLAVVLALITLVPDDSTSAPDPGLEPAAPDDRARAIHDVLTRAHFTGTALVALDGEPVLHEAFGYADREARVPSSLDTVYDLGSLTKPLTAVTVLDLRDDGLLRLDQPICDVLDDCPRSWRPVTIHDLLTHRSGLPDFTDVPSLAARPGHAFDHDQMVERLGALPVESRPGVTFDYSNSNYFLLARIVEEVTDQGYPRVQQERVFTPLGMISTATSGERQSERRARGYVTRDDGATRPAPSAALGNAAGSGDVSSTTGDVLRWSQAVFDNEIVAADTVAEMLRPVARLTPGIDYGMGWGITRWDGDQVDLHIGGISGFAALLATIPDDGVTIVLLSNDESTDVLGLGEKVAATI
jgi:D-alanyl-D-alanine carboxypeptidase